MKSAALDETIRARLGDTMEAAARCELFAWRTSAGGRLAEIIVLDQFSRNDYRDTPRAFAQDALRKANERADKAEAYIAAQGRSHRPEAQQERFMLLELE